MKNHWPQYSMRPFRVSLLLMLGIAWLAHYQLSNIAPVPDNLDESQFSGERAHQMLANLIKEQVPHAVDSPANRLVGDRIIAQLRQMGFQESVQETEICSDWKRGVARCTKVRNIITQVKGREPGKGILLSAHYDSVPAGPGGSDAGAAVVTLLETARLLARQPRPKNTIVFLFNEGEEFGLFGAEAFMQEHPVAKELQLAINIEARGTGGKSVMFETGEDSGWLVEHYANVSTAPLSSSLFYEVYKYLPNDTDLTVFKEYGLQGLNFAHAEREPHYHTPLDNLENLSPGTLQYHGDNVWGILSAIKDADLAQSANGNRVYTDILGLAIVSWPEANSLWFSIAALVIFLVLLSRLKKQGIISARNFFTALLVMLLSLVLASAVAYAMQWLVQTLSSTNAPWRANEWPMRAAIWSSVTLTLLLVGNRLLRGISALERGLAICGLWTLAAILTSWLMAGISFLFLLPLAIALPGLALGAIKYPNSSLAYAIWMVVSGVAAAITFLPVAFVLEVMVSYYMSLAIGLFVALAGLCLLPLAALKDSAQSQLKYPKIILLIITAVTATITITQPPYSNWMPRPLNLVHWQSSTGESMLLTGNSSLPLPASLRDAMGGAYLESALPWWQNRYHAAKLDFLDLPQPKVEVTDVTAESKNGAAKSVSIQISGNPERLGDMAVYIPKSSELVSIDNGTDIINYKDEASIRNGFYEYRCRGQNCAKLSLILNFASAEEVSVSVVQVNTGLPAANAGLQEARGDLATPRHNGDQTYIEVKLTL